MKLIGPAKTDRNTWLPRDSSTDACGVPFKAVGITSWLASGARWIRDFASVPRGAVAGSKLSTRGSPGLDDPASMTLPEHQPCLPPPDSAESPLRLS
jgi:hypothetical protein